MKLKYVIGFVVIAACVAVGIFSLKSSMTPYLPFEEAMSASGRSVQVIGKIVKGSSRFNEKSGLREFTLRDEDGKKLKVSTKENLPSNFEHATSVVAVGSYKDGVFNADRVLVKCPSKYEKKATQEHSESRSEK